MTRLLVFATAFLLTTPTAAASTPDIHPGQPRWLVQNRILDDRGILNFYVVKRAATQLADDIGDLGLLGLSQEGSELSGSDSNDAARKAAADFRGAAGTLRFADGGAELHLVGGLTDNAVDDESTAGDVVGGLPGDTAAVLGFTPPKD